MSKKTFFSFLMIFFIFCNKDTLSESEIFLDTFESYIFNQSHSSDYIFNQNNLHRFDIYISDKNLKTLDDDPSAENYVEGSIVFENKIIKKVGIRYKGSIGFDGLKTYVLVFLLFHQRSVIMAMLSLPQ